MYKSRQLLSLIFSKISERKDFKTDNLPLWISKAGHIFELDLDGIRKVYLIEPNLQLEFDQLVNLQRQTEKIFNGEVLLVADNLNPKFRPLFVRMGIPFIYKNQTIFAPNLGIKLINVKDRKIREEVASNELSPFELKLIGGFFTHFQLLGENLNLKRLREILIGMNYLCSPGKLSKAIRSLNEKKLIEVKGLGPERTFKFTDKKFLWREMQNMSIRPFYKKVPGYQKEKNVNYIISGESALTKYSSLAKPKKESIAITLKDFKKIKINNNFERSNFFFDIFKESPNLFSKNGYLNPIEVYFMLRNSSDERIQMALAEMIFLEIGIKI